MSNTPPKPLGFLSKYPLAFYGNRTGFVVSWSVSFMLILLLAAMVFGVVYATLLGNTDTAVALVSHIPSIIYAVTIGSFINQGTIIASVVSPNRAMDSFDRAVGHSRKKSAEAADYEN